jgi:hypothetical protein
LLFKPPFHMVDCKADFIRFTEGDFFFGFSLNSFGLVYPLQALALSLLRAFHSYPYSNYCDMLYRNSRPDIYRRDKKRQQNLLQCAQVVKQECPPHRRFSRIGKYRMYHPSGV